MRSRPRASQLSALASPQSQTLDPAASKRLERRVTEIERSYPDGELPLPTNWGGFRLDAETFEFWQQRHDRLHDRLLYSRADGGGWSIERLAP